MGRDSDISADGTMISENFDFDMGFTPFKKWVDKHKSRFNFSTDLLKPAEKCAKLLNVLRDENFVRSERLLQ